MTAPRLRAGASARRRPQAVGCADENDDACIPGRDCTCADEASCIDSCDGEGCNYTCTNTQTCTFDCEAGGCNLACTGATSCTITGCSDCVCSDDSTATGVCGL